MAKNDYNFSSLDFNQVSNYPSDFLFLSKRFLEVQKQVEKRHFSIEYKGKVILTLNFSILDKKAISPYRAPFGGLNEIKELPEKIPEEFIRFIEMELQKNGISSISITFPPICYSSKIAMQIQAFLRCGWQLENSEIGFFLELKSKSYWQSIDPGSKNRLNKANRAKFNCQKIHSDELASAYEILVSNRIRNDYPITMKLEDLNFMLHHFKEYELFGVYDGAKMISMAICIEVSPKIAYLFYLADLHEYRSFSPNILLLNYIYDYYLKKGSHLFDLGLVSENSIINRGLFNFKKNLGGNISKKYSLIKHL